MAKAIKMPNVQDKAEQHCLPAGCFSSWLRCTRRVLLKENGAQVNCGECRACCKSSYFIHIRPEETKTLALINNKFLVAAPGLPEGNVLLGYYKNGCCPMFIDDKCSIYEHRPLTCRNYDCRVFPAAGIAAGGDDKALINQHIKYWKFSYPNICDYDQHSAVKAAASFLQEHPACFTAGVAPNNPSQLAIIAIKSYDVFLNYNDRSSKTSRFSPDSQIVKAIIKANKKFEARFANLLYR